MKSVELNGKRGMSTCNDQNETFLKKRHSDTSSGDYLNSTFIEKFNLNEKVYAQYLNGPEYYEAEIVNITHFNDDVKYKVKFTNGEVLTLTSDKISVSLIINK